MSVLEPKDIAEITTVEDDTEFRRFQKSRPSGLMITPETYGESNELALKESAGDFAKWLRTNAPEVPVEMNRPPQHLVLRSGDYWMPLVFLATNVALPVYLNLVASYIHDKLKGALKSDKTRVRLSAVYEDTASGLVKRFDFDGDEEALAKAIHRFDLNKFFDE